MPTPRFQQISSASHPADTALSAVEAPVPVDLADGSGRCGFFHICLAEEAPGMDAAQFTTGRPDYIDGLVPVQRPTVPSHDSAVVVLLLGLFLFVAANFKHYGVFLRTLFQDLLSVRRRANAFDEHTVNETRIMISLILTLCFGEGLLLFSAIYPPGGFVPVFPLLGGLIALTIIYYVMSLAAYATVGHVFTDPKGATLWVKGYKASQGLLGIALVVPALVSFFYPEYSPVMVAIGIALYVIARIVFICKGFKIFYNNLFSLVYFILYLCALEIAPLVLLYRMRTIISLLALH